MGMTLDVNGGVVTFGIFIASSATIKIEQMITGFQANTIQVVGVMDAALPQVAAGGTGR